MSGKRARGIRAFRHTGGLRPGRSVFDLTHEHKLTCDMGQLIPVLCTEMSPGDRFIMSNEIVLRLNPTLAPILHEVNVYTHTWFVPLRLLFAQWEDFVKRGEDGDTDIPLPVRDDYSALAVKGTLLDYFGFPLGVDPQGAYPLLWPWRAYNLIWNENYRDQDLEEEVELDQNEVLRRAWEKDYFTVARPDQQRGTSPAVPLSGLGSAVFSDSVVYPAVVQTSNLTVAGSIASDNRIYSNSQVGADNANNALSNNVIDFSNVATFNTKDLRVMTQIQKWQERMMRAGGRYTEIIQAHFGESIGDDRLQRPEYVGGTKAPIIISEVLQTSSTDGTSPQGNLAGHGVAADRTFIGDYHAREYGILMTLMSVMPRTTYQQGINRMWLRRTVFDYLWPEYTHLSEQAVTMAELYATNDAATNMEVFGYQGQYDELRYLPSYVSGDMRDLFDYWHMSRKFENKPLLNSDFVRCNPTKRIFAVPSEHGLLVNYASVIKAIRPLPVISEPGLLDHF